MKRLVFFMFIINSFTMIDCSESTLQLKTIPLELQGNYKEDEYFCKTEEIDQSNQRIVDITTIELLKEYINRHYQQDPNEKRFKKSFDSAFREVN